jgi:hypothetical protein
VVNAEAHQAAPMQQCNNATIIIKIIVAYDTPAVFSFKPSLIVASG